MKTEYITKALRASTSPASCLAAWQNRHIANRRKALESASPGQKLSLRRSILETAGPELSSPESKRPLLWVSERSPEVLALFAGRDSLDHRGWYTDEFQHDTLETYAAQLTQFPRLMFYAVKDSCSGDFRVMLDDWEEIDYSDAACDYSADECIKEAARDVVRSNDSSTEREAEKAREYYRKDRIEMEIADNREALAGLRSEIRELCRELKTLCPSPLAGEYPAAAKAVRSALSGLLASRSQLMEENQALADSI